MDIWQWSERTNGRMATQWFAGAVVLAVVGIVFCGCSSFGWLFIHETTPAGESTVSPVVVGLILLAAMVFVGVAVTTTMGAMHRSRHVAFLRWQRWQASQQGGQTAPRDGQAAPESDGDVEGDVLSDETTTEPTE